MGSRILLADDSITIQKVVNLTFADEGIEVVAVSSGDLAERRLNEVKPDLVLADIFMPGKNGYELCESIKQNSQFRNVPVVLLVGAFEPFDQAEARRVQADAHLTKPFESRTLVETVRRLIGVTGGPTSAPISPPNGGREEVRDAREAPTPAVAPPALNIDLSAMTADSNATVSIRPVRTTGELASPMHDSAMGNAGLGVVDLTTDDSLSAALSDTSEPIEPIEFSSSDGGASAAATPFDLVAEDTVLDFDKSESFDLVSPQNTSSFKSEANCVLDVDLSGAGEVAEWASSDDIQSATLDLPSDDGAWQPNESSTPIDPQPTDAGSRTAEFSAAQASSETVSSILLAVDEPLGDLLFDEPAPEHPMHSGVASSDSLDVDLSGEAMPEAELTADTEFNLVASSEGSSSRQAAFDVVEQVVEDPPQSTEASPPVDVGFPPQEVADSLGWTSPRASAYSTERLEPIVMPIDGSEQRSPDSHQMDGQLQPESQEASFTTATMWKEEQARFTPIDVEAVNVEGPEGAAGWGGAPDTGFSFSSVATEQATTSVEAAASVATAEPARPLAPELSSAAIEEIVRRVVAEVSESVVREVAWEVVPDCVERVIEQLTRESLAKRM